MIRTAWRNEKFRYLLIGAYNTAVGYGVFALVWSLWNPSLHYLVILFISHIISVTNAYFGYRIFVFRSKNVGWHEFVRFNTVYLGTLTFNVVALPTLVEWWNFHPLGAQGVIVVVTVISSYLFHRRFSFRQKI